MGKRPWVSPTQKVACDGTRSALLLTLVLSGVLVAGGTLWSAARRPAPENDRTLDGTSDASRGSACQSTYALGLTTLDHRRSRSQVATIETAERHVPQLPEHLPIQQRTRHIGRRTSISQFRRQTTRSWRISVEPELPPAAGRQLVGRATRKTTSRTHGGRPRTSPRDPVPDDRHHPPGSGSQYLLPPRGVQASGAHSFRSHTSRIRRSFAYGQARAHRHTMQL